MRLVDCPICDHAWPDRTPQCLRCCYDFTNRDARMAIRRIRREGLRANAIWLTGTAMVFLAPAALFGLGLVVAGVVALSLLTGGALLVTFGLLQSDCAKKRLARALERTQLPPARLL
jgi:hypothetical protein